MEVRCGGCNKLFRVSDDKITGTGIKFPCTRCGAYVRITRQDLEHYTLSQSAVSVLDLFEPKPKPATPPVLPEASGSVPEETASPSQGSMPFRLAGLSTHEDSAGGMSPPSSHSSTAPATEPEPAAELKPEPFMPRKPKDEPPVEPQPEQKLESKPLSVPQPEASTALKSERRPEPVRPLAPVAPTSIPPARPAMPKKEVTRSTASPASPAAERSVRGPMLPSTPSHSGRMFLVLFITLIISCLAAYGIYIYLQASPLSPQGRREAARETVSIEGLQIANPGGSVQENGDLLISGIIRNTTEKEKTAWYVVTEVYDAQGAVLSRLRLLNGKQIYSRSDYDILAGRGVNVQELKAKNLQDKGVIIPPKGTVNFEMRYLQPPAGIASFDPQLLPFDPIQLYKEITGEVK